MLHYLLNEPDSRHFQTHSGQCFQGETATSIEQKNVLNLSDLWHPLSWVRRGGKMGGHWGGSVRSFNSLSPSFMSYVSVCLLRPIDNSNPQGHVVLSTMCSYQRIHVFFFFFFFFSAHTNGSPTALHILPEKAPSPISCNAGASPLLWCTTSRKLHASVPIGTESLNCTRGICWGLQPVGNVSSSEVERKRSSLITQSHLHCNTRKFKRFSTYCDNYLDNSSIDDYSGAVVGEFAVWYASCIAVSATPNKSGEEIGQR